MTGQVDLPAVEPALQDRGQFAGIFDQAFRRQGRRIEVPAVGFSRAPLIPADDREILLERPQLPGQRYSRQARPAVEEQEDRIVAARPAD